MPAKNSQVPQPSAHHPPVGTRIDDGALELVEVLGVGGYGVVYRAVDAQSPRPQTYAVKCLTHNRESFRQRIAHMREIALHQIASAHPNVVTLHRVIEEEEFTYIVMDYATDGDLFSQILHKSRYQGDDYIIKQVFLQLLDAVEYCHTLGVYHRDIKPENILCFDGGMRIAITDFGLATSDRMSVDFRTGSIYHMSPECHDEEFARKFAIDPTRPTYSPMANDIWSLAVVLLNIATGRNPWRSASVTDPTFQAYLRDPENFMPSVLPVSSELNAVLIRMLAIDWQKRLTMSEVRQAIEGVNSFYSGGVIFDGGMAKCPWEADVDLDDDSTMMESSSSAQSLHSDAPKSHWSADSTSEIVFASRTTVDSDIPSGGWRAREQSSANATWAHVPSTSDVANPINMEASSQFGIRTPATSPSSSIESYHPIPSLPSTPSDYNTTFERAQLRKQLLTIDTNAYNQLPKYYNATYSEADDSSMMHTAVEHPTYESAYESSYYLAGSVSQEMEIPESLRFAPTSSTNDKEMTSPYNWDYMETEVSLPSVYSMPRSCFDTQNMTCDESPSMAPTPDTVFWPPRSQPIPIPASREEQSQPRHTPDISPMTNISSFSRPDGPVPRRAQGPPDNRFKPTNIFNPIKLFPRPTSPSPPPTFARPSHVGSERHASDPNPPLGPYETSSAYDVESWCTSPPSRKQTQMPLPNRDTDCRREAWLRSPRRWFSPGRFFSGAGVS